MRALIYCRVSTKEQTQNLSIPVQRTACRAYCAQHGLSVAREFIEQGESAKTADRTQLKALLAYCVENRGQIAALVVYNLSRFSRDRLHHVLLRAQLQKLGVTLRSVMEPIDDTSTGRLMEGIVATFAQFDNDVKAERTTAGMRAALELGRFTFKAPLGYLNAGPKCSPSLVPDPARSELLRFAFAEVAAGGEVADVLRQVTAAGLKSHKGKPVSLQTFRTLLKNSVFIGRVHVPKWGVSRPGDFEGIVGEAVFRRVQQRLVPGTKSTRHVRDRDDFPLRRFLTCVRCQRAISGSWSKGRNGRYAYYHCPKCRGVRCRRETTEAAFLAHLEALKPAGAYLRLFRAVVVDVWRAEQDKARDLRKLRTARVAELQERLERLEEAFIYARSISQTVYQKQRDRVQQELTDAELHLDEARAQQWDVEGIVAFAEHLIANLAALWLDANLQQRQAIQRSIFPEGLPFDGHRFGTALTSLLFNGLQAVSSEKNDMASPTGFEPVF